MVTVVNNELKSALRMAMNWYMEDVLDVNNQFGEDEFFWLLVVLGIDDTDDMSELELLELEGNLLYLRQQHLIVASELYERVQKSELEILELNSFEHEFLVDGLCTYCYDYLEDYSSRLLDEDKITADEMWDEFCILDPFLKYLIAEL